MTIYAIILYMTTLPIADARAQLSKLVDEASSTHERYEITKNGHRAAVLMGVDDYDAMRETIAVLSDQDLLRSHQQGLDELNQGESLNEKQLGNAMKNFGRGVDAK
jgi:antitoxin YefM